MLSKTKKMMMGALSAATVASLSACGSERPEEPIGYECDDWEWDKDTGAYYCDDDDSTYARGYYHGGGFYKSKKELQNNKAYQSYYTNYKSGIGSGTKGGFGG